jgi:hypothetical protein
MEAAATCTLRMSFERVESGEPVHSMPLSKGHVWETQLVCPKGDFQASRRSSGAPRARRRFVLV